MKRMLFMFAFLTHDPVAELGSFLKSMLSGPDPDPTELNRFPGPKHPLDLVLRIGFSNDPVRRA